MAGFVTALHMTGIAARLAEHIERGRTGPCCFGTLSALLGLRHRHSLPCGRDSSAMPTNNVPQRIAKIA